MSAIYEEIKFEDLSPEDTPFDFKFFAATGTVGAASS
jgi:hypothetical protein